MVAEQPQSDSSFADLLGDAQVWVDVETPASADTVATGWAMDIHKPVDTSWRELYQWGDEAFELAKEIEAVDGELTPAAIVAYKVAVRHLVGVTMLAPVKDEKLIIPNDSVRLFNIATSHARLAQAAPSETEDSFRHQELATDTLERASILTPNEVVVSAARRAAQETGTPEHLTGQAAREGDPGRLDTEDWEAIAKYIGAHAMVKDGGTEFAATMAGEAVEQITDSHEVLVAA